MTDESGARTLQSVAAHLQGLGIGMAIGMGVMLATTDERAIYAVTALGLIAVTAGYIVDKRRLGHV